MEKTVLVVIEVIEAIAIAILLWLLYVELRESEE